MASGYATGFLLLYGIFCNFLAQAAWVEDSVELYPTPTHRMQRLTNFTRCGGDGKVTEIREDSCENLGDKCRYKIDEFPRHQQMDFVPGKEHKQIGVRITLFPDGQESKVAIDRKLSKSFVKAGTEYTVAHSVFLDPSAKGLSGLSRHEIYDVDDLSTIVCAQGYFIVE